MKITKAILSIILIIITVTPAYAMPEIEIESEAVVVLDARTGAVLFERRKDDQVFPASVTKVMTALLAIENSGGDYDQRVPFSYEAVHSLIPGSSNIAMDEGETLSLNDALYALMLASANEVSNAIAEFISGDMVAFAESMNARALEIGAVNTNYTNAHGLPDDEHFTTAYEAALIMREAVQHPKFIELISTQTFEIMPTERQPEVRPLNNTNRMIQPHSVFFDPHVVGGKTGFTNAARHTLATYGRKGDIGLIVVTMLGDTNDKYNDTSALLEYGFLQFEEIEIFNPASFEDSVAVVQLINGVNEVLGRMPVRPLLESTELRSVTDLLPKHAAEHIRVETILPDRSTAPINKGDILGELRIFYDQILLRTIPLEAESSIEMREPISEPIPTQPETVYFEPAEQAPAPLMWSLLSGLVALALMSLSVILALRRSKRA